MPDTTNDDKGIRLPRHVHRKRIKLMKRKQRRQQQQQKDTTNTSTSTLSQPQPQSQAQTEEDTALYLQQKAQWEEKERQYDLINLARKKVIETEKKAREEAMNKWHASLRDLPIPKPHGYLSTSLGSSSSTRQQSTIHKIFISSSPNHTEQHRRKTYRGKFELSKKTI
ncbi:hypothetical protein [Absidia glauca]|uniref:Uncharacterized protein n=1 Tax=Absidia glauca TaxID=4829 RepID=A0A163JSF2_ABSGL|nr:hypothetical protein [Absidia glauca]